MVAPLEAFMRDLLAKNSVASADDSTYPKKISLVVDNPSSINSISPRSSPILASSQRKRASGRRDGDRFHVTSRGRNSVRQQKQQLQRPEQSLDVSDHNKGVTRWESSPSPTRGGNRSSHDQQHHHHNQIPTAPTRMTSPAFAVSKSRKRLVHSSSENESSSNRSRDVTITTRPSLTHVSPLKTYEKEYKRHVNSRRCGTTKSSQDIHQVARVKLVVDRALEICEIP
mmetsp:Transcript_22811/g.42402  ORF Transcript_22811/g.42402 Transcript_22811/m.42402 type:complete len:227 (+) Transcript_22811:98-778(+)|eukprot:CAMPEP_0178758610 /NCGR_PEP_ID=MMETSP0744-20121128/14481_1 /TAXON_ID=913974 /ORGANISM="Nitzschia punctata, Strain CCMP561" /LENGTH=226 /DNA_ID=CAMNT_0020412993 /DNA_START=15 /DNA_END=695 /DNA_ORIENTATION=+